MKSSAGFIFVWVIFLSSITSAQEGLVGYWSFDNVSDGIIRDQTSNSNDGTGFQTDQSSGIKGKALSFNGVDSYVEINGEDGKPPSLLSELGVGTISVWFKVENIPLQHGIAPLLYYGSTEKCDFFDAANQGLIIELGHSPIFPGSEEIFYTVWSNGCTLPSFCFDSGFNITKNKWHHFVVVVGETYNTGYLNGEELVDRDYNFGDQRDSEFFADAVVDQEFWLGKGHWDRTEQFFDGTIDELKIFNRPLSDQEVKNLYNEVISTSNYQLHLNNQYTRIYPNPAKKKLYMDLSNISFNPLIVHISDATGKRLLSVEKIENYLEINLDKIPAGLYTVNVIGENEILSQKVIVED